MEIRNEIRERPKRSNSSSDTEEKKFVRRSATEVQRSKLEKLMANPDKPIIIPERQRERDFSNSAPTFVRNVMGSSAGAGSGEFHVYRNLRRKEYARLKAIEVKSKIEELDDEFKAKLDKNRQDAEDKTAKKRAKRLKKKQRAKNKKPRTGEEKQESSDEDLGVSDEEEESKDEPKDKTDDPKDEKDEPKAEPKPQAQDEPKEDPKPPVT